MKLGKLLLLVPAVCLWACSGTPNPDTLEDLIPLFTAGNVPENGPAENLNIGENFKWRSDCQDGEEVHTVQILSEHGWSENPGDLER